MLFQAFSDESRCYSKRYQGICLITGSECVLNEVRDELRKVLVDRKVGEVKFSKVGSHIPYIEAAKGFLEVAVKWTSEEKIRIDNLVWDTKDKRHSIIGRDDKKNMSLMYYKILRHSSEKWNEQEWEFFPDERSCFPWEEVLEYINNTLVQRVKPGIIQLFEKDKYLFNFKSIKQLKSHEEPLIQLADLFAGIACFSNLHGKKCCKWIKDEENSSQLTLFNREKTKKIEKLSVKSTNRFTVVQHLNALCKKYKLNVSLNSQEKLWTPNPRNNMNFWNYQSKHNEDKAPVRKNHMLMN